MFKIKFPRYSNYEDYYKYVLEIFKYIDCDISYVNRPDFIVSINGKDFLFDFWNHKTLRFNPDNLPIFKFQTTKSIISSNVIPFPKISFYNWDEYKYLEKQIQYNPRSSIISSRQKIYGNAVDRRTKIQKLLKDSFEHVLTDIINQIDFWKEISQVGIFVCVPGQNNNILDRGQLQQMAFGACTISPHLPEIMPYCPSLDGCYIQCKDDYSDLISIIQNKPSIKELRDIGFRAKQMFQNSCTPEVLGKWIDSHLSKV